MRPLVKTPAHQTDRLAELVCSNSFKSVELTNAHGLLKAELRALGSLLLPCADLARVPAGSALAVDRELFSQAAHDRVTRHPNISIVRDEVTELPDAGVVATGPLTSERLTRAMVDRLGASALAFYDAIAPVVSGDSLDLDRLYALSRYGKGDGDDYLNAPMDAAAYEAFIDALVGGRSASGACVRRGAVLRGMSPGRRDGEPRAGDAPLRADEAGGAGGPEHRPRASRRGSAASGRSGRADVEPRRISDAAPDTGAATRLPNDSRDWRKPSF